MTTAYLPDTAIASQDLMGPAPHVSGSFTRVDGDEGTETLTGGNGLHGNDETSENLSVTWADTAPSPNTGTLTTTEPLLFMDGFEYGDVSDWSAAVP